MFGENYETESNIYIDQSKAIILDSWVVVLQLVTCTFFHTPTGIVISSHTTADKDISGNHGVFSCSFMLKYCNIFTQYSPILTKWVMLPSKHRFWLVSREFIRHMEREEQQKAMKNNLSPSKLLKKRKWMENWRSGPPPDWNCKGCSLDAVLGPFVMFDMFKLIAAFCWPQNPFGPSK